MEASYKIISADPTTGIIQVSYGNGSVTSIELPLDQNNNIPEGEDLDNYIKGFLPIQYLQRLESIKTNGIANFDYLSTLIEAPVQPVVQNLIDESDTF